MCDPLDFACTPGAHLCLQELSLLLRLLSVGLAKESEHSGSTAAVGWSLEARNSAPTRVAYESGTHTIGLCFTSIDASVNKNAGQRLRASKLVLQCDGRDIAVLQVSWA